MADDRSLVRRWEEIEPGKQFAAAYVVLAVVLAAVH